MKKQTLGVLCGMCFVMGAAPVMVVLAKGEDERRSDAPSVGSPNPTVLVPAPAVTVSPSNETPKPVEMAPKPVPEPMRLARAPRVWLGLDVMKPDGMIYAQLPELPYGFGFLVKAVEKDSPGAKAGLVEYDVIWKLNDQILVNEGQLAALLRLSKPGDEVVLSGFRAGKELKVNLKLAEVPAVHASFPPELVESAVLPGLRCGGAMREVNVGNKTAVYTHDDGKAEIGKEEDGYRVKISNPSGEVIFEGLLKDAQEFDKIPGPWRYRVHALRRGLDMAIEGKTGRFSRPRVVPPAQS